ncbi:major capsid protein [Clostridium sp. MSJ-11]|uniref:Major capsid protein n=1 Tax=Clostridium mobile TaxID=2841512 RepID=A0ABS6EMX7_9CLOT|nr:major capsid protein [Clostridium mobile]MBU5486477.1 major capsid protein [Clostridium mobile]
MARIEEMFSTQEVLNYVKNRQTVPMLGDILFPEKKIEDLDFKMIKGANNLPVSASIHGFDTETEIGSRDGASSSVEELALIKRKIKMDERLIIKLNSPRSNQEEKQAISDIFNDVDNMVSSVKTRVEAMRMEAVTTGKLTINENGVKATIDYGTPSEQQSLSGIDWTSSTAKILDDIYNWTDKVVANTGFTPTRALTSKSVLNLLLTNTTIRKAVFGTNSDRVLTKDMLNQLLSSMDLPQIATYDAQYRTQNANGKYTAKRYFEDGKFVLLPDGKLGESIYGLTAEEIELRGKSDVKIESFGNIIAEIYSTKDPVARWTKAVATCLPSFPYADQIYIAKVK